MLDQILRDQQSYYIHLERDLDVCTKFHGNPSKSCWHILHKISWFWRGKAREKVIMLHPDSHPTNQMSAQNAKCVAGCAAKVKGLPKASRNYPLGTINVCARCHGYLANSCQDISTKNCQLWKKKKSGSSESLGFIPWGTWISLPNFLVISLIVAVIFCT